MEDGEGGVLCGDEAARLREQGVEGDGADVC